MKSTGPTAKRGPVVFSGPETLMYEFGTMIDAIPAPLWREVDAAYATPGRAYHTIAHVREVLRRCEDVAALGGPGWQHPDEVLLAALFHDAVYVPGAKDNEARSAELARDAAARYFPRADAG